MVAVIAARTRTHSKPSRKTSTPMSSAAALKPKCGARGSGLPAWLNACQVKTVATVRPATDKATREAIRDAGFVPLVSLCCEFRVTLLTPDHYISNCIADATHCQKDVKSFWR